MNDITHIVLNLVVPQPNFFAAWDSESNAHFLRSSRVMFMLLCSSSSSSTSLDKTEKISEYTSSSISAGEVDGAVFRRFVRLIAQM